jgi:hypothetical protein
MGFVGRKPTNAPLTSSDLGTGIVGSANIADGTIANTDIASSIITGQTAETSIAGGDSVLIYDDSASALRKMTRTNFVSGLGGLTEADCWRISANHTVTYSGEFVTANWERVDTDGFDKIGTGMTQSSGEFTFPSTGYWLIIYTANFLFNTTENASTSIQTTTNNSTYDEASRVGESATSGYLGGGACSFIFDVTSTANCKVKFYTGCGSSGNQTLLGNTGFSSTHVTWIKLGET